VSTTTRQGPTEVLRIKAAVRERDGYRCTDCGMTNDEHLARHGKSLHVHRLVPGSRYAISGGVTLCYSCHSTKPRCAPGTAVSQYRTGVTLHIWIPPALREAIDALATEKRRALTTEVIIALEKHLTDEGKWPPPPAP
jgi:hypothetical protein